MARRDIFHDSVKKAVIKEGWIITNDPLSIKVGGVELAIDLGAEKFGGGGDSRMEKVALYRSYIKEVIKKHSHPSAYGDVEIQNIFDSENDHYQLIHLGWDKKQRQYGCIVHVDIKDGKIWIQHDGTETGIANELVDLGVPKEDIVLAYHPPYKRPYTDFAVA